VSISPSVSPSISISPSVSQSLSPSVSPSPSPGWISYTKGNYGTLPTNKNDLTNTYTSQEVLDVAVDDSAFVGQEGEIGYNIHQFKDYIGDWGIVSVNCVARSSLAPSSQTVLLQAYNHNLTQWETLNSNNSANADTDFTLSASISTPTDYWDVNKFITCRVYQTTGA